nr:Flp pilus assembly complex ATPase component TadA [Bacilli bacterium]
MFVERPVVDQVLACAFEVGASDVHFDPHEGTWRVLIRLYGVLFPANRISDALSAYVSKEAILRLKVLAKLNIGEQRIPQDGQVTFHFSATQSCDLRINCLPTLYGERVVVRLLDGSKAIENLTALGMREEEQQKIRHVMHDHKGLIIVAGSIGSGKSTTMHTMLLEQCRQGASVLSLEDPIERKFPDFTQVQIDEKQGMTFAQGLRAALRQDPDTLMVGEIRDGETADIAVRAGMIGHLIISSIHANRPEGVMNRLLDFGVHPLCLEEALRLVIFQTLDPQFCQQCLGIGCDACHGIGYVERKAAFQVMTHSEVSTQLLTTTASFSSQYVKEGAGSFALRKHAKSKMAYRFYPRS